MKQRRRRPLRRPAWKQGVRREIRSARRIVVLGVGNPQRGDDCAGLLSAAALKKIVRGKIRSRLKIFLGYEIPENFTGKIRTFDPALVLILDSALGPHRPGTVFVVDKDGLGDETVSTHKISPSVVVSYLEKTVGCRVMILGIQPRILEREEGASPPVKRAAVRLAAYLARCLCG